MSEYAQSLGDAVRRARGKLNLTQGEVAAQANMDSRTILNIENYKGNPKLEILYPLIRTLHLDPQEIFYPELVNPSPAMAELQQYIADCTETEAEALLPIIVSVLTVLRKQEPEKE